MGLLDVYTLLSLAKLASSHFSGNRKILVGILHSNGPTMEP